MRILADLDDYIPLVRAGSEITLHTVLRWLVARGHQVTVTASGPTMDEYLDGVRLIRGVHPDNFYPECDVVITQQAQTPHAIRRAKHHGGKPVVYFAHNSGQLRTLKVPPGDIQLVVYNSYWLADALQFHAPGIVVRPVVWANEYTATPAEVRDYITHINLAEIKGGAMFWQLARHFPQIKFLGVRGMYGNQIVPPTIPDNVTLEPSSEDPREVYARTYISVMPSKMETYGRVAVEAACNGIPLVLTPTSGLQEAILPDNALWAYAGDVTGWVDAITRLVTQPQLYKRMAMRAYHRSQQLQEIHHVELLALETALAGVAAKTRSKVIAIAQEPQYAEHIAGVMHTIPPAYRGPVCVPVPITRKHVQAFQDTATAAYRAGLTVWYYSTLTDTTTKAIFEAGTGTCPGGSVCLVASQRDHQLAALRFSSVVRMEHGAGQTYHGVDSGSFAGSKHQPPTSLFLAPTPKVASHYPRAVVIGCPKLYGYRVAEPSGNPQTIAFSFRYPGGEALAPELGTAWHHFLPILKQLSAALPETRFMLHAHPRAVSALRLQDALVDLGDAWSYESDFAVVAGTANVLCVDNSSVAMEWCYLNDKPLLLLSPPGYRRWVHHGLRFWEMLGWPNVHDITNLEGFIQALTAPITPTPRSKYFSECTTAQIASPILAQLRSAEGVACVAKLSYSKVRCGQVHYVPQDKLTILVQKGYVVKLTESIGVTDTVLREYPTQIQNSRLQVTYRQLARWMHAESTI